MLAAVTVPYKSFALLPFPTGLDSETPPQAAQLVEADPVVQAYNANGSNVPGDPGSATVTF